MNSPTIILTVSNRLFASFLEYFLITKGFLISNENGLGEGSNRIVICDDISSIPRGKTIVFIRSDRPLHLSEFNEFAGVLSEKSSKEDFLECLAEVSEGRRFVSGLLEVIPSDEMQYIKGDELTGRERELLHLYARGLTMTQMAERLCISKNTVNNHLAKVRKKMNLSGPNSLVRFSQTLVDR